MTLDGDRTAAEQAQDPGACCYQWHVLCAGGRALQGEAGPITAAPAGRDDWLAPGAAVDASAIAPATRDALATHWEREAAFEHASVAAFAHASLALLAVGAPPDLVLATHSAAIDEVEHARLAYALASSYAGLQRGPGPLPVSGAKTVASLAALAVDTFIHGCAGEASSSLALYEAATLTESGTVRAILEQLAEDEERHAELAWRTVAWALRAGGEGVARELRGATSRLRSELAATADPSPAIELDLSGHGALGTAARRAIRRRAIAEVVIPCAETLLATAASREARAGPGTARASS